MSNHLKNIIEQCRVVDGLLGLYLVTSLLAFGVASAEQPRILNVQLRSGEIQGMPIVWNNAQGIILDASGAIHDFLMPEMMAQQITEQPFRPDSLVACRTKLQAELGADFETAIAGPYVIAARRGELNRWNERFTSLLAGYIRYFETRGWKLRQPDFPLSVIVMPTREAFREFARREGVTVPAKAVGCYMPQTNRCVLYQISGASSVDWVETESTIVHEAVHQLAHNTGVHERLFDSPAWFVEGLAVMFEVPNVYDPKANRSTLESSLHPYHTQVLQSWLHDPARFLQCIESLIASDELFNRDSDAAYAISWGMTFYFMERMPSETRQFVDLQRRRGFGSYSEAERVADFREAFAISPDLLAPQLIKLYKK